MVEPTGYTALDLIGFTDKGPYDPTANYVKNDLVHVGNSTWRCKIDDTTGITPTEGANWTIFIESATSLAGMSDVDLNTPKAGDGLVHDGNKWTNIPIMTKEQWKKNGAYNLCPNENTTQTIDGVTFTVNSDGSVTANGTCGSTGADFDIPNRNTYNLGIGTYKLVGCPSGGSTSTYMIGGRINGSWVFDSSIDTGNGAVINVTSAINAIVIRIKPNTVCNNLLFKPMITTDLNATYDDFVPHAMTNRKLTEEILGGKIYNFGTSDAGTNVTFLKAQAIKMGDIVFLTGSWVGNNTNAQPIFTVPTDLRPKKSGYVVGSGSGERNDNSMSISGQYILNSSGALSQSLSTTSFKEGSFTFIYSISKS